MSKFTYLHATSTKWGLTLAMLAALGACGGGGGGGGGPAPIVVANADLSVAASSAVLAAVAPPAVAAPIQFSFLNGFSGTGGTLTGPTTVSFTSAVPAFSITNGGSTATGVTTFGSCIFTVASTSPFTTPSPLAANAVLTVNPCNLSVSTGGAIANGASVVRNVFLTLGLVSSAAVPLPVTVSSAGVVTVNGVTVGTVAVITTTGTTGAGG